MRIWALTCPDILLSRTAKRAVGHVSRTVQAICARIWHAQWSTIAASVHHEIIIIDMMCNVASTDGEESLRSKRLTAVPERLKSLTALTSLDLSDNPLTELPDWLGNLTALTSL